MHFKNMGHSKKQILITVNLLICIIFTSVLLICGCSGDERFSREEHKRPAMHIKGEDPIDSIYIKVDGYISKEKR